VVAPRGPGIHPSSGRTRPSRPAPARCSMDGSDRDLGWEDVGLQRQVQASGAAILGQMSASEATSAGISDAVTSAMVNHFAREITQGSLSLWPQFVQTARQYFNVTHGYVLRKMLWQVVPLTSPKKKSTDGEIGAEKDWTARVCGGLEVDIEEPDMYIPVMSFMTYVLLCGLVRGLQEQFHPDVLSATITFAVVVLILETTVAKAALVMVGAVHAPVFDVAALLGYKYLHMSFQLITGLILGWGRKPEGFIYCVLTLGLLASCGLALWQSLRRLARMQPAHGQECMADIHKIFIKALPVLQALVCWFLLPSWPKRPVAEVLPVVPRVLPQVATTTTAMAAVTTALANATKAAVAAASHAPGS